MISSKNRIFAALEHRALDRIPICEQYIWPETLERWREEGLPQDVDPIEFFHLDNIGGGVGLDCSFFPHEIYEETDEYCVDLNGYGTTVKWYKNRGSSSGHSELDHKVRTIEDWRRARERLNVSRDRLTEIEPPKQDRFIVISPVDHYWMSYCMCGMEDLCCWLALKPDEMLEIYDDYTDFLIGMLDLCIERGTSFDGVWFFSDMAFSTGPMFSPEIYRNVVRPSYDRIRRWCTKHGLKMFLHCDGNLDRLMGEFVDTGFDLIHPLEARAGNDVRILKPKYGDRITLMGNINADVLARGDRAEVEEEIASKIPVARDGGGYLYNIDHSVPPTVSFDTYCYAIELVGKYGQY